MVQITYWLRCGNEPPINLRRLLKGRFGREGSRKDWDLAEVTIACFIEATSFNDGYKVRALCKPGCKSETGRSTPWANQFVCCRMTLGADDPPITM